MRTTVVDNRARVQRMLLLLIVAGDALFVLASVPAVPIHGLALHATKSAEAPHTLPGSGAPVQDNALVASGGTGRLPAGAASAPAAVVRGFPTYPGASWNGDLAG